MDIKVMIIYSFGGKCWQNGLMPMSVLCQCFRSNIPTNDQSSFFFLTDLIMCIRGELSLI